MARNPPQFFPGATYLGPTSGQLSGWDTQLNYADQVFGGQQAPRFGEATGAMSNLLGGGGNLGSLAGGFSPFALNQLSNWNQFGQAGGMDASGALQRALSGQADYGGLQGAIEAANAPILRQFQQEIIPGLNQRATFLNNETGGIKALNRVMPEIGERMALNAQTLTNNERLRALSDQQRAAEFVSSGGMQANQGALGLGGLAGNMAAQQSGNMGQALQLWPMLAQAGQFPGQLASQFGDWGAGFQQRGLQDNMDRWNYYQNLPQDMATWYNQLAMGTAGLGGTTRTSQPGSTLAGAAGGALAGAQIGGPWGAVLGGLLGGFG